jgi:7-keto-8-aminopelargonate synthetase-like enzyme
MIYDAENHASLIDASRLAMGPTFKYKHNDMESLEEQLQSAAGRFRRKLIVADGVFSMSGAIVKLPEIVELAKKYGAEIFIDDAHGTGVMGPMGRGTVAHFNLTRDVDYTMGTFSKSFASIGGFVTGSKEAIDFIRLHARSFMFSASMPPSAVATVSKCLEIIQRDADIHTRLWDNVAFVRQGFKDLGFYTYNSQTPIIPIFVGDDLKVLQLTNYLEENGIFATPVISPAVPKGEALIRTSYMPSHTREDLTHVLEVFAKAKKEFQIPSRNQAH